MNEQYKCHKFAKVLETVAKKLRSEIGETLWEKERHSINTLAANLQLLLILASKIEKENSRKPVTTDDKNLLNDWPDIIT